MWHLWCFILNMKLSEATNLGLQSLKKIFSGNLFLWAMRFFVKYWRIFVSFLDNGELKMSIFLTPFFFFFLILYTSQGDRYAYILQKCASEWQEPWNVVYVFSSKYQGHDLVGSHHVNTINSIFTNIYNPILNKTIYF